MSQRWYDNPNAEPRAGHLIKDNSTIELFAWLRPDEQMSGGDVLNGNPFSTGRPEDRIGAVQNYFAEYHLEYYRQRLTATFRAGCTRACFSPRVPTPRTSAPATPRLPPKNTSSARAAPVTMSSRTTTRVGSTTCVCRTA